MPGIVSDMVGPEGSSPEDTRLQELFRQRQMLENTPEVEEPSMMEQLMPLIMSQGMDLLTTQRALGSDPNAREVNPIPGMGSLPGRVGINALQAFIISQILNRNRSFGNMLNTGATGIHGAAALNNLRTSGDLR